METQVSQIDGTMCSLITSVGLAIAPREFTAIAKNIGVSVLVSSSQYTDNWLFTGRILTISVESELNSTQIFIFLGYTFF